MEKLVNAPDSKSAARKGVGVRVSPPANPDNKSIPVLRTAVAPRAHDVCVVKSVRRLWERVY